MDGINLLREYLKKSQLFSGFDESMLGELAQAITERLAERGEMIFRERDPAFSFYIVESGKVKIFKQSAEGKEQILLIASEGDSFAEAALFADGRYPASAQALEDSRLLKVDREQFLSLLTKEPQIALNLIAQLSIKLHRMARLVEELSLTDISTRLAHYLTEQVRASSPEGPGQKNPVIKLKEKKTVLAAQLGTIPETLSRAFSKLTREKIIAVDGVRIEILDLNRLQELSGDDA